MWKWLSAKIKSRLPLGATWGTLSPMTLASWQPRQTVIRSASHPICRAFALSLAFHLIVFGAIETGHRFGWWKHSLLPAAFLAKKDRPDSHRLDQEKNRLTDVAREVPLVFVDIDPAQAVDQPPEQAKYYSSRNTRAANRDNDAEANIPKITGTQEKVPKTVENARSQPAPLQPAPPVETKPEPPRVERPVEPKSASKPGDLAMAKSSDDPRTKKESTEIDELRPSPPRVRPRKLDEVKMAQAGAIGEKMKQEGGARRYSVDGLDVKASPFGSYDAFVVDAIRQCWFRLLDERDFARGVSGKVVLTFRMNSDGSVTQMDVAENEVNELSAIICQRAVQEPAKYPPWPSDMRRLVGAEFREVRFTFHYN
jgi:outer membrane biosynthesis protein TonB